MLREYGYTVEWRAETRQLLIDAPDMAEAPWGLTVNKEISNYGATGESEYFYLMSEKHFEDGVFYGGGMGKGFPGPDRNLPVARQVGTHRADILPRPKRHPLFGRA